MYCRGAHWSLHHHQVCIHDTLILTEDVYLDRAYKLMFLSYCVSLAHQTDETDQPPPAVCRLPRARGARGKGLTPPPPYDSPPPYHVAIVMCAGEAAISPVIPAEVHISDPVYI